MKVAVPESSHGSEAADVPPPPPIVQFASNNNVCTQEMTNVIKMMYNHSWPSYKKIHVRPERDSFRNRRFFVQLHFIWEAEHDALIRKIYDHRMGRRLQQMLEDALLVHWETGEGFRHRRLTNRANRTSTRSSKYTGGSATFMKIKARLLKSLDREVTLAETFKYTHTLKENKARFADQQSQDHYESYTQKLEVATQQSQQSGKDADGSIASVVDPDAVWCETASAPYKNCVYGMGSFFASNLHISTLRPWSASATSRAVEHEKGMDLRLQV
ncbi:hypothetical protein Ahy_B06g080701 [Arachis hypogaea]|uniref:Uncharacterized protein n=1 Tax=Arachis hypogaea TaxID=3818 RepID=A0A444YIQ6_ARAHY|nr:hypothetical protein Ahy_B06g080701 [Arachis hypogaea]